jgi:hypothetical protein
MQKTPTLCLAITLASLLVVPAWGDPEQNQPGPSSDVGKNAATPEPASPPTSTTSTANPASTRGTKASLPKKALGLVFGAVVGTPVCVVRKTIDEEKYGINGMIGTTNKKSAQVAAGIFWAPFALFTGTVESPVYSAIHSLNADEPFSKEQFSLGDVKPKAPPKD